uniref:(northern house mosquito) hypothetical protein n=1 Tax=Culex pipiens TaxID=7175 RepID=A0A8D8A6U5_CULPI
MLLRRRFSLHSEPTSMPVCTEAGIGTVIRSIRVKFVCSLNRRSSVGSGPKKKRVRKKGHVVGEEVVEHTQRSATDKAAQLRKTTSFWHFLDYSPVSLASVSVSDLFISWPW